MSDAVPRKERNGLQGSSHHPPHKLDNRDCSLQRHDAVSAAAELIGAGLVQWAGQPISQHTKAGFNRRRAVWTAGDDAGPSEISGAGGEKLSLAAPGIVHELNSFIGLIKEAAEDPPDFDEIVETDPDLMQAHVILRAFAESITFVSDDRKVVQKAFEAFRERKPEVRMLHLNMGYRHFADRRAAITPAKGR